MLSLAAAVLLTLPIPPGVAVTPVDGAVVFSQADRPVTVAIREQANAVIEMESWRQVAASDPAVRAEDTVVLGYAGLDVEAAGGERRLYLSFGADHLVIVVGAQGTGNGDMAGAAARLPAEPADLLRPGGEAGRHPGQATLLIDGFDIDDTARRLPTDFFTGPLSLEIVPDPAE
ncbi:MAG: hypothetical protein AAF677_12600 [Pseudomonadota bacterium]